MPKFFILTSLLVLFSFSFSLAQNTNSSERQKKQNQSSFKDRLRPGGNVSLQFKPTRFLLYLILGYQASEKFTLGVGGQYQYFSQDVVLNGVTEKLRDHYYGGSIFGQYALGKYFRLRAETEAVYGNYYNYDNQSQNPAWAINPMLGAGLNLPLSKNLGIQVLLMYNLNYDRNLSLYNSPWVFRIGLGN